MASVMGVVTWSALKKNIWRKERLIIALFSIGCFFISLEELSYGQKIFNWQTPSLFKEYNLQQEINLHNLKELSSYIHLIFMVVGFYGGFAWVYKHISRGGLFTDLIIPDWHYAPYFFITAAFYFYFDYIRPHFYIIGNEQEVFELILSFGFFFVSVSNYHKVFRLVSIKTNSTAAPTTL
jgi:hypothetical protein